MEHNPTSAEELRPWRGDGSCQFTPHVIILDLTWILLCSDLLMFFALILALVRSTEH